MQSVVIGIVNLVAQDGQILAARSAKADSIDLMKHKPLRQQEEKAIYEQKKY